MMVKVTIGRIVLVLVSLMTLGLGAAAAGLVPIAASTGHWQITDWFLHWTMQNSARTYSAVQTPEVVRDDTGLISAAGHFRQSCQVCHGAPGEAPSPVMLAATPPAPDLSKTVERYTDRELFWIVRHGVKFTGMPAWPASDRDDEVRRMVGFLRRLPFMSSQEYKGLTGKNLTTTPPSVAACAGCHGKDGLGRGQTDIPVIAGQDGAYMIRALRQYKVGQRSSAVMRSAAARLSERDMIALGQYFASLPGLTINRADIRNPIAVRGLPAAQLPACSKCHREGSSAPRLAGQHADYLLNRLQLWRGEDALVDAAKPQDPMAVVARRIPDNALKDLAESLAAVPRPTSTESAAR